MDNEPTVNDVVNLAINNDVARLEKTFDSVIRDKISQELESRRQIIGQTFGNTEGE